MELDENAHLTKALNARPVQRLYAAFIDLLIAGLVGYLLPIAGPIVSVTYFLTKDALPFLKGQSLGKRFVGIKVVNNNQEDIINNYPASILRSVTLIIPLFNLFDAFHLLFNENGKRWGDVWAKTIVVNE